jgi:hypothetical protein
MAAILDRAAVDWSIALADRHRSETHTQSLIWTPGASPGFEQVLKEICLSG